LGIEAGVRRSVRSVEAGYVAFRSAFELLPRLQYPFRTPPDPVVASSPYEHAVKAPHGEGAHAERLQLEKALDDLYQEAQACRAAIRVLLGVVIPRKLAEIESSEMTSDGEVERAASACAGAAEGFKTFRELEAEANALSIRHALFRKRHDEALLRESGFGGFDELERHIATLERRMRELEASPLDSLVTRFVRGRKQEKAALLAERKRLREFLLSRRAHSDESDRVFAYSAGVGGEDLLRGLFRAGFAKIAERGEILLNSVLAPESDATTGFALAGAMVKGFNQRLAERFRDEARRERERLEALEGVEERAGSDAENLTPEAIKSAEAILLSAATLARPGEEYPFLTTLDVAADIDCRYRALPGVVQRLLAPYIIATLSIERRQGDDTYREILEVIRSLPRRRGFETARHTYRALSGQLGKDMRRFTGFFLGNDERYALEKTIERFRKAFAAHDDSERFYFGGQFDGRRWSVMRDSKEFQEVVGREVIKIADRYARRHLVQELVSVSPGDFKGVARAEDLLSFAGEEALPVVLLYAFQSTESPFLPPLSLANGALARYVGRLDGAQVQALQARAVPGLLRILEIIRADPFHFAHTSFYDYRARVQTSNPQFEELHAELARMAFSLLKSTDEDEQVIALRFLARGSQVDDLGDGYELILRLAGKAGVADEALRRAAVECITERACRPRGDARALSLFLELARERGKDSSVTGELHKRAPALYNIAVRGEVADPVFHERLSALLGISRAESENVFAIIHDLHAPFSDAHPFRQEDFYHYLELARHAGVMPMLRELAACRYSFDPRLHTDPLIAMLPRSEEIIEQCRFIREYIPSFAYHPMVQRKDGTEVLTDPIQTLRDEDAFAMLDRFVTNQEAFERFRSQFARSFMESLLASDPVLRGVPDARKKVAPDVAERFAFALRRLSEALAQPEGILFPYRGFFTSFDVLRYLARQPERVEGVISLPSTYSLLFDTLMKVGGPLAANTTEVMRDILKNGGLEQRAKTIESVFRRKVPYWKQLFLFTDARLGEQLALSQSTYPITDICGIPLTALIEKHAKSKKIHPERRTRLESVVGDAGGEIISRLLSGSTGAVPFSGLTGMYKRLVFRDYIRRTVEHSRSDTQRKASSARNREYAGQELRLQAGMYLHGSSLTSLEPVLLNGNLPGEALGEAAKTDSYPFHVDFSHLSAEYLGQHGTVHDALLSSISANYGAGDQLFYLYDRTRGLWELGKRLTVETNENHALMLGGIPSTEISAVILRTLEMTFDNVARSIVENGMYIPVYDMQGMLIFSPDDFDRLESDLNARVSVEVWDFSLKTGEQRGSNPGGEFTVPQKSGSTRYYVKFAERGREDRLWNEQLADSLYKALGIPVPETRVVRSGVSYGHASRVLEEASEAQEGATGFLDGFIADAFLANWDIVRMDNLLMSRGILYRIDNGGALLFRARGERKDAFGGVVTELETMRSSYPGLTEEAIVDQAERLKKHLSDAVIDRLVDGVRLPGADRIFLKDALRKRRDYIVNRYMEAGTRDEREVSPEGRKLLALLAAEETNDAEMAAALPIWRKLIGDGGYQHNGVLLGDHIKGTLASLKSSEVYRRLSSGERQIALLAALFHDIAKPVGRRDESVPRDFEHEIPGAQIAANHLGVLGFSDADIGAVVKVITYDGVVSDIARGRVRDPKKNLAPTALFEFLGRDHSLARILEAVNRADVIATVGESGYAAIHGEYDRYFREVEKLD
ncbi:MAG: HD domain-containing protein, partial [Candidatus Colwellbacteria bacterium]|nr:HD domain-containing protein [Candidatus Colwellbacteria bacterium]